MSLRSNHAKVRTGWRMVSKAWEVYTMQCLVMGYVFSRLLCTLPKENQSQNQSQSQPNGGWGYDCLCQWQVHFGGACHTVSLWWWRIKKCMWFSSRTGYAIFDRLSLKLVRTIINQYSVLESYSLSSTLGRVWNTRVAWRRSFHLTDDIIQGSQWNGIFILLLRSMAFEHQHNQLYELIKNTPSVSA